VNVSVRHAGEPYRTRCEIKNVNSIRFVMHAIEVEAARHVEIYESGGTIAQETRAFDPVRGETRSLRSKEDAHDYRYFPDPDLLPLVFDEAFVEAIRVTLPELPDEKKLRFVSEYGITPYDATVLVMDRENADFFERVISSGNKKRDGKQAANWVISTLFGTLNKMGIPVSESPVSAENLGLLLDLIDDNTISGRLAKDIFEIMVEEGKNPATIVEERGLRQVTDTGAIDAACDAVIAANPEKADEVRGGKDKLIAWFMGQVMKQTGGKANPAQVQDVLRKKLLPQ
jgi:aspartyl-tRNA(Asn)/glutamyl-tRNA(Gln) amidotransferase subunit B